MVQIPVPTLRVDPGLAATAASATPVQIQGADERGSHDALLVAGGLCADLFNSQFRRRS